MTRTYRDRSGARASRARFKEKNGEWGGYDLSDERIREGLGLGPAPSDFECPGGNSALRRATRSNPRNLPCPTCKQPNRLTPADVRRHYQCDACADRDEGGGF